MKIQFSGIKDPRNTILIVGWQAPVLADRASEVRIFGGLRVSKSSF